MNEKLTKIIDHPVTIPLAVGIAAFGIGGAVGYILGRKHSISVDYSIIEKDVHEVPGQLKFDVENVEVFIAEHTAKHDVEDVVEVREPRLAPPVQPQQTVEDNIEMQRALEAAREEEVTTVDVQDDSEPVVRSIFPSTQDEWDYDVEVPKREEYAPYVLHRDEFYGEEKDFTQTTLTYYAGDKIMTDQDDTPVYNFENVVGELKFGHGSGDPNVFYIRNEQRREEYEVIFDPGHYSVEILGLEIEEGVEKELRHSSTVRKFRIDD